MSSFHRQSVISLQSKLTEELISEPFSIDGAIGFAFHEDIFHLFEGAAATIDGPPALPTDHLLPSFEGDHLGPPFIQSEDGECINFVDFTTSVCNIPLHVRPEDFLDPAYQAAYRELFLTDQNPCAPADITAMYEAPLPAPATTPTHTLSTSFAHLPTAPVNPSTMTAYASCFDCAPQVLPLDGSVIVSPPSTTTPSASSGFDGSDPYGDGDYVPSSGDHNKHHQTSRKRQKRRKTVPKRKSPRRMAVSPPPSTPSKSEESGTSRGLRRSYPYSHKTKIPYRNFQCKDSTLFIDSGSNFQCPVVGCDHGQENKRISDLRRHIKTHIRWMEPEKWICCGVGMDRAHSYGKGIKQGMTDQEWIEAGAYMFGGRLMIGGCMKTFSRRDALKRHVDSPKNPCVGHMDSYNF